MTLLIRWEMKRRCINTIKNDKGSKTKTLISSCTIRFRHWSLSPRAFLSAASFTFFPLAPRSSLFLFLSTTSSILFRFAPFCFSSPWPRIFSESRDETIDGHFFFLDPQPVVRSESRVCRPWRIYVQPSDRVDPPK